MAETQSLLAGGTRIGQSGADRRGSRSCSPRGNGHRHDDRARGVFECVDGLGILLKGDGEIGEERGLELVDCQAEKVRRGRVSAAHDWAAAFGAWVDESRGNHIVKKTPAVLA